MIIDQEARNALWDIAALIRAGDTAQALEQIEELTANMSRYDEWKVYYFLHDKGEEGQRHCVVHAGDIHKALWDAAQFLTGIYQVDYTITKIKRALWTRQSRLRRSGARSTKTITSRRPTCSTAWTRGSSPEVSSPLSGRRRKMLGWMARSAIRNHKPSSGSPTRASMTPGNNIPGAVTTAIVVIGLFAIFALSPHGPSAVVMVVCALLFSVLVLGGWIVRGVSQYNAAARNLRDLPDAPHAHTSSDMRARAAQLHAYDEAVAERERRVKDILAAVCPVCGMQNSACCSSAAPGKPVYVLDRWTSTWAHGARIGAAIRSNSASTQDVAAQFKGHVPADVWEYL